MAAVAPAAAVVCGYALTARRCESFFQAELLEEAERLGVEFRPLDAARPLEGQGPLDVVLHKLSGEAWKEALAQYKRDNPNVVILDHYDRVQRLNDRVTMLEVVELLDLARLGAPAAVPRQLTVPEGTDPNNIPGLIADAGLRLPLVAKPLKADSTSKSHNMCFVLKTSALSRLTPPLVAQEFVNHGGLLFKLYVIGEKLMVFKRQSLPDIPLEYCADNTGSANGGHEEPPLGQEPEQAGGHEDGIMEFNKISNQHLEEEELDNLRVVDPPPDFMNELGRQLKGLLGLQMFNVDVLRENGNGDKYYIVDINYFPGYERLPEYEHFFPKFIRRLADRANQEVAEDAITAIATEPELKMTTPTPYRQLASKRRWSKLKTCMLLAKPLMSLSSLTAELDLSDHLD
eukprot:SM000097S24791  [mRNA]  locus=s97:273517:275747:- [translate_table: standard]